ncbi:MAG: apolipoprotein N-acyltransferase [bacterium]
MKDVFPGLLSGVLLVLSSAPFDFWGLAYISMVPLFLGVRGRGFKETAFSCASTGALLATGWYYSSISFSPFFFLLVLSILSLSFMLWGLLTKLFLERVNGPWMAVFVPVVLWTGIEGINTSEIIGMPTNLGFTQAVQPLMIQSASLFGIYGVSFIMVLVNSAIADLILQVRNKSKHSIYRRLPAMVVLGIFTANIIFGYMRLNAHDAIAPSIKVSTVQPVISTDMYVNGWRNPENRAFMKATFDRLTDDAVSTGAKMIVWPEGGNGYMNMRIPELRERIYKIARENDLDFIVSTNDINEEGEKYNSIFSISREGSLLGRYDKVRLVPVAEKEYTAGKAFHTLASSSGKIGPAVCFESCFPSILRKVTSQGAEILLVSTSDATFKRSVLALNHARASVFRAVENGRWVIRAANTGPSMIISPTGKIVQQTKFYDRTIMVGEVAPLQDLTFFTRIGFMVPACFAFFVLIFSSYSLYGLCEEKLRRRVTVKVKKQNKKQARQPKPVDIGAIIAHSKAGLVLFLSHLCLIFLITLSSIYFVKVSTGSEQSYADTLKDLLTPAGQIQAERVTERFLQANKNTCGPAVLAYVLSFLGQETLERDLIGQVHLDDRGTSMLELKKAALGSGFDASGVQENYAALMKEVLPVIAYINDSHYVVVNKVLPGYLFLFDPAIGHVSVSKNLFEQMWNGYLLLIRVKPIPQSLTVRNGSRTQELKRS